MTTSYDLKADKHHDLNTTTGRLAATCQVLGIPPCPITYDDEDERDDAILITDEFVAWFDQHNVSLDWIICGAVGPMLQNQQKKFADERVIAKFYQSLPEEGREIMMQSMTDMKARNCDEALAPLKTYLAEHPVAAG